MTRARVVRLSNGKYAVQRRDFFWWHTSGVQWEADALKSVMTYVDFLNSPKDVPVEVVYPEGESL